MKPPTNNQLLAWWAAQPRGQRTCADCGRTGDSAYVQPQHPFFADGRDDVARCADCISARNAKITADHKAKLAAMPRCELEGCTRRGTFHVGHARVLLCGWHKRAVTQAHERNIAAAGALALFLPGPHIDRAAVLRMAAGQPRRD